MAEILSFRDVALACLGGRLTWRCGWNSCAPIPLSLKSGPHSITDTITLSCSWLTPSILSASPLSPWLVPLLSKLGSAQWNEQHGLNPNDKGQRTEPQLLKDLLTTCRSHTLIPSTSCSYDGIFRSPFQCQRETGSRILWHRTQSQISKHFSTVFERIPLVANSNIEF